MADSTYQTLVQINKGGGSICFASGSFLQLDSGMSYYFDSSTYAVTQDQIKSQLFRSIQKVDMDSYISTNSLVYSTIQLISGVKYIIFSMRSNTAAMSAILPLPSIGMELYLILKKGSVASGQVVISCSTGVSLVTILGTDNSRLYLYCSAASCGIAHLVSFTDGEWSVVGVSSLTAVGFG